MEVQGPVADPDFDLADFGQGTLEALRQDRMEIWHGFRCRWFRGVDTDMDAHMNLGMGKTFRRWINWSLTANFQVGPLTMDRRQENLDRDGSEEEVETRSSLLKLNI